MVQFFLSLHPIADDITEKVTSPGQIDIWWRRLQIAEFWTRNPQIRERIGGYTPRNLYDIGNFVL